MKNIRNLIFDVSEIINERPKYILVDPTLEKQDISYWSSNRFECVPLTFVQLMEQLGNQLDDNLLKLSTITRTSTSTITKHISSHEAPSDNLALYLERELLHIHPGLTADSITAHNFYKGNGRGFGWLMNEFDIPRRILDTILEDTTFDSENEKTQRAFFSVVKGYAGSGKSVFLKRTAWEIDVHYNLPTFYLNVGAQIRKEREFKYQLQLCFVS